METNNGFEQVYRLLQFQPKEVASEIFQRIRQGADVHNVLRFFQYSELRLQLSLVPDASSRFASPYLSDIQPLFRGPKNPYLDSKLYNFLMVTEAAQQSGISMPDLEASYHLPYPGARLHDARFSSGSLMPSRWTSISSDDRFLRSLLEVYFLYEFPIWPCFHKDALLDDMVAGRKDCCSPFLVNVILTAGCHGLSALQQRSQFWNPRTYSYQFLAESRRQWELEETRTLPSITTVQAATILGRIYFTNGMDSLAWSIWAQATAMAEQLDLFSPPADSLSDKERICRTITVWGLFSQQAFSCFYIMKPPLVRDLPKAPLPSTHCASRFFGEIWVTYPHAQRPIPIAFGHTFVALVELRCIMHDIASKVLSGKDGRSNFNVEHARNYHSSLDKWYHDLPDELQPRNIVLPSQLQLHMQYHNLITMIFRPFLSAEQSHNGLDGSMSFEDRAGFSPVELISSSQASLETLLHMFYHRHGFEAYYIFLLQVLHQLGFDALERLSIPDAHQKYSPEALKAIRATLILCAKGLHDQGRNFYLSECVFRVIREKMDPADVGLLEDWAQIKDDEEAKPLMKEHVHPEYPINIVAITQDPSDRRLYRLLESVSELKLRGEEGQTKQDEKSSRTWRSIVS